jgi:four helix bundle protein
MGGGTGGGGCIEVQDSRKQGGVEMVRDFKELRVYRQSYAAAKRIQELSETWPRQEQYAMTDQIRRSSRSVCANIAESWFKRRYPNAFVSKLSDACSEAAETIVWIGFARDYRMLDQEDADSLESDYRHTIGGLVTMMNNPHPWCGPSSRISEDDVPYRGSAPPAV